MKRLIISLLSLGVLGYLAGWTTKRLLPEKSKPETANISSTNRQNHEAGTSSSLKFDDSLASLAELPAIDLYPRLALWLLDASVSEIQEFWTAYLKRPDQNPALTELIFINWTRIDPAGAIAATKGTEFEKVAWAAWAGNDPDRALRAALALAPGKENKDLVLAVVKSLGKSQPAWLREHLEDLPEDWMKNHALHQYTLLADAENPRESIAFLKDHGRIIPLGTLAAFARESPLEAFNLALQLRGEDSSYSYTNQPDDMIAALAEEDPALLDQILSQLKSPETRMKIQLKQFELLLASDPEAAEKQLQDLPTGWAKQDQLALLGNHFLKSDPARALEIANQILSEKGRFGWRPYPIVLGDQSSFSPVASPPSSIFLDQILATNPQALMENSLTSNGTDSTNSLRVAAAWAKRDLPGYADWATTQKDSQTYPDAASTVTYQLLREGHMTEAMEWAESIPTDLNSPSKMVTQTFQHWISTEPEAAKAWKEGANLNEAQLEALNQIEHKAR